MKKELIYDPKIIKIEYCIHNLILIKDESDKIIFSTCVYCKHLENRIEHDNYMLLAA